MIMKLKKIHGEKVYEVYGGQKCNNVLGYLNAKLSTFYMFSKLIGTKIHSVFECGIQ